MSELKAFADNKINVPKPFTKQSLNFTIMRQKTFENIVRKKKNASNQHFLLFPQCFLACWKQISDFHLF